MAWIERNSILYWIGNHKTLGLVVMTPSDKSTDEDGLNVGFVIKDNKHRQFNAAVFDSLIDEAVDSESCKYAIEAYLSQPKWSRPETEDSESLLEDEVESGDSSLGSHDGISQWDAKRFKFRSDSAWRTYFRLLKGRSCARYQGFGDYTGWQYVDGIPNIAFSPEARYSYTFQHLINEFPWRVAALEISLKLGLRGIAKQLGRVVSRMELCPYWLSPLSGEYSLHAIPKRSGGKRIINEPSVWLMNLQRAIYVALSQLTTGHPASHGFEPGRSIYSNAQQHCRQPIVMRLDLLNAFRTTKRSAIEAALKRDLASLEFSEHALKMLGEIFTYKGALPTGAPSSPYLLNRVLYEMDTEFHGICFSSGLRYSRYADDLIFSGRRASSIVRLIREVAHNYGYKINEKKTRVYRAGVRQSVTGLVVNESANLSRNRRRLLRALVHAWCSSETASLNGKPITLSQLQGHIAYYAMVSPEKAKELLNKLLMSEAAGKQTA